MLRTTQCRMLRLVIRTKRKIKKKKKEDLDGTDIQNEDMSEDTQEEEDSTHDEYDQDNSISFEDDADGTTSQEDELEDWVEYIKRSAREKLTKNADTQTTSQIGWTHRRH